MEGDGEGKHSTEPTEEKEVPPPLEPPTVDLRRSADPQHTISQAIHDTCCDLLHVRCILL